MAQKIIDVFGNASWLASPDTNHFENGGTKMLKCLFRELVKGEEEATGVDLTDLADSLAMRFYEYMLGHGGEVELEKDIYYNEFLVSLKFRMTEEFIYGKD